MQFLPNLADPRSTLGTPTLQFCWFYIVFLNILMMYTIVAFSFLLRPLGNFWCPFEGALVSQRAALRLPGHPREHPGGMKIDLGHPRGAPGPLEGTRGPPLSSQMLSKCFHVLKKGTQQERKTTQHNTISTKRNPTQDNTTQYNTTYHFTTQGEGEYFYLGRVGRGTSHLTKPPHSLMTTC